MGAKIYRERERVVRGMCWGGERDAGCEGGFKGECSVNSKTKRNGMS